MLVKITEIILPNFTVEKQRSKQTRLPFKIPLEQLENGVWSCTSASVLLYTLVKSNPGVKQGCCLTTELKSHVELSVKAWSGP